LNTKILIKIASVIAVSGLSLVICTLLFNLFIGTSIATKNTLMLIGFAMMFLGTLWKVVLEMNSPEE
jgi:hypothetical protein